MAAPTCHKQHEHPPTGRLHPIRAFNPTWNELYHGKISDVISTSPCCCEWRLRVQSPLHEEDLDSASVAMSVDGACRNNGRRNAQASIGVYFGPRAESNYSELLPEDLPATNQVAELYAAISALQDTLDHRGPDREFCKVLILTDSKYLVDGISEWIWKWKRNGYLNVKGLAVTNKELFQTLDCLISRLEQNGSDVWFWHVGRENNREADRLANEALDSSGKVEHHRIPCHAFAAQAKRARTE